MNKSLPDFSPELEAHLRTIFEDNYESFLSSFLDKENGSFRVNKKKLNIVPEECEQIKWTSCGYKSLKRPSYTFDPWYHAGIYYSQEPASMFIEHIVKYLKRQKQINFALDLCAAPGGKTLILSDILDEALIVSNEVIAKRAQILKENSIKWGNQNVVVTNNDPAIISTSGLLFDLILVDAPCSGEGLFRKDEASIKEWSEDNVALCAARQKRILAQACITLADDGFLVYSTCTYNERENEENCLFIQNELGFEPVTIPVDTAWNISSAKDKNVTASRFFPHKTNSEGLFVAVFKKKENSRNRIEAETSQKGLNANRNTAFKIIPADKLNFPSWLKAKIEDVVVIEKNNVLHLVRNIFEKNIIEVSSRLRTYSLPGQVGEFKNKTLIPSPEIAFNKSLEIGLPICELNKEQALLYLSRQTFKLPLFENGLIQFKYKGQLLGFGKKISDTRWNNYFPEEWRIIALHKMPLDNWCLSDFINE